jgi:hypothetical protein
MAAGTCAFYARVLAAMAVAAVIAEAFVFAENRTYTVSAFF